MAAAGYAVEILFGALGIIPVDRAVAVIDQGPAWNYSSVLNLVFLILAGVLAWRFFQSGGLSMLRTMGMPEGAMAHEHGGYETQPPSTDSGMDHSTQVNDPSEHTHHHDH
jgi:hypothetical protein